MRHKTLFGLCILPFIFSACSSTDSNAPEMDANALGSHSSALKTRNLKEVGGSPWSDETAKVATWNSPSGAAEAHFGYTMVMGDFRKYAQDLLISETSLMKKGTIYGRYSSGNTKGLNDDVFSITRSTSEQDSFGYAMISGNFCEGSYVSKRKGDILIASMPTAGDNMQGGISLWGWNKSWKFIRDLKSANPLEIAGIALAAGDLDGDGKVDLVYGSMPLDSDWNYLPGKVSVALDLCSQFGTLTAHASVEGSKVGTNFGADIQIADLDGQGTQEIIVVDNFDGDASGNAPNGIIHFYKLVDGELVESRPALEGDTGAFLSAVAFSDIDRDGDLDLIVGEPKLTVSKKEEGGVRTYTNEGPGMAFNPEIKAWSATSDMSYARFGSTVVIADVNQDGVDDLIVGAPGKRDTGSGRAQGRVLVYVGTNDGSIFSTEPYWHYISDVSSKANDDFGRDIIATQLDKTGWLDLIVAAPNACTSNEQIDNVGRVDIFTAGTAACYRADMCQVDGICYEAGQSAENLCEYCDPTANNFAMMNVTCEESDNACATNMCNPETGACEAMNLEDGTSCGESLCDGNQLSTQTCLAGVCTTLITDCGDFRCSEAGTLVACMPACETDDDCDQGNCVDGICELPEYGLPVIVLADYPTQALVGSSLILDASGSYDDDGGDIWMSWWSSDAAFDLVDSNSSAIIELTVPEEPGIFNIQLLVTDDEGLTSVRDIRIEAVEASDPAPSQMRVKTPLAGAVVNANESLEVTGESEPESNVNVVMRATDGTEIAASCESIADTTGNWSCTLIDGAMTIPAGDYVITATTKANGIPVSYDVDVHLSEPVSTDEYGNIQGGACAMSPVSSTNAWWILFAGLGLALIPMRRRQSEI